MGGAGRTAKDELVCEKEEWLSLWLFCQTRHIRKSAYSFFTSLFSRFSFYAHQINFKTFAIFFFLAVSPASIVTKCSVIHLSESHRDSDLSCRRLPDCHLTKHFENNGVFRNRQCGNKDQAEGKIKRRGVGEKQQQFNFCAEQ